MILLAVGWFMEVDVYGGGCLMQRQYTVSHFSYAPLFQGPYFLTKMPELNILYDTLLINILSVFDIKKISESLVRNILLSQMQF